MAYLDMRTWAEIDLARLERNYKSIRAALPPGCRFAGLCKANAYGHGLTRIAHALEGFGAEYLAVSCYSEALELRRAGVRARILILAPSPAELAPSIAELDCEQAVGSLDAAREMSARLAGTGRTLRCHLKLETGMGRTGFDARTPAGNFEALEALKLPRLEWPGVFTHFAASDEPEEADFTRAQFSQFLLAAGFLESAAGLEFGIRHCSNSGAVINFRNMALEMVRPGLLLYGIFPGAEHGGIALEPVMSVKTRIAEISEHRAGDTISYGRTFACERDMRLAVIPIGYADGLHRAHAGKFSVLVNGCEARQVGRICMDMCMIDVTDIPAAVGDVVTVFGDSPGADALASSAGTIAYELLCAVSPRVPRIYLPE